MKVNLETTTLAVLVSGIYCTEQNVDSIAIPQSVWMSIAEKLEFFLPVWDYEVITFEEWVKNCLFIYPKVLLDEDTIEDLKKDSIYWEYPNGNVLLFISMNIKPINTVADNNG